MSELFRKEFRAWLDDHPPPAVNIPDTDEEVELVRQWHRTLHADGWIAIHWPEEWGGRGAPPDHVAIYNEELARVGAPPLLARGGISLVGPTLMAHGTEEQRQRWIPRIVAGEDVWCQLFSEPDAGSDLASLTTRAERHGDTYVVNGQKVWSSYAQFANYAIALVRTDPNERRGKGISMLAIPMKAPGVEIRPLRQITGASEFFETFLTDVEVPVENRIGPEHEGWRVTNTTLANERGSSFIWREQVLHEVALEQLLTACPAPDPVTRQRLVQSWIDVKILGLHNARTLEGLARGEELGAGSSVVKLWWANTSQRLHETAFDLVGERWADAFLASRATSIMGGTSEIQRNIIGERILGLPR